MSREGRSVTHIGIVEKDSVMGQISTIEGNLTVRGNSDFSEVRRCSYSTNDPIIVGYGSIRDVFDGLPPYLNRPEEPDAPKLCGHPNNTGDPREHELVLDGHYYRCKVCKKRFPDICGDYVSSHGDNFKLNKDMDYQCMVCGKIYKNPAKQDMTILSEDDKKKVIGMHYAFAFLEIQRRAGNGVFTSVDITPEQDDGGYWKYIPEKCLYEIDRIRKQTEYNYRYEFCAVNGECLSVFAEETSILNNNGFMGSDMLGRAHTLNAAEAAEHTGLIEDLYDIAAMTLMDVFVPGLGTAISVFTDFSESDLSGGFDTVFGMLIEDLIEEGTQKKAYQAVGLVNSIVDAAESASASGIVAGDYCINILPVLAQSLKKPLRIYFSQNSCKIKKVTWPLSISV